MKVKELLRRYDDGERYFYGADLRGAKLVGADLVDAKLVGADLRGADLRCTNLIRADLRRADLRGAKLVGANLIRADLRRATIDWTSHALVAEILRQAAEGNVQRCMVAGLVLLCTDWCWKDFLKIDHPEKEWALDTLAKHVKDSDNAPSVLRERIKK